MPQRRHTWPPLLRSPSITFQGQPLVVQMQQIERIADMVFGMRDFRWDAAMTAEAKRISAEGELDDRMKAAEGRTLSELLATPDVAARWARVYDQAHNNRSYRVLTPEGGAAGYVTTGKGAESTMMWKS